MLAAGGRALCAEPGTEPPEVVGAAGEAVAGEAVCCAVSCTAAGTCCAVYTEAAPALRTGIGEERSGVSLAVSGEMSVSDTDTTADKVDAACGAHKKQERSKQHNCTHVQYLQLRTYVVLLVRGPPCSATVPVVAAVQGPVCIAVAAVAEEGRFGPCHR